MGLLGRRGDFFLVSHPLDAPPGAAQMSDDSLIEVMARAICLEEHCGLDVWDELPKTDADALDAFRKEGRTATDCKDDYLANARAALAALRAHPDWALVPRVPTEAMLYSG